MNATLDKSTAQYVGASAIEISCLPMLVVARLVCEWARIDPLFPIKLWGHEYLGTPVTIANDRWLVGSNAQGTEHYVTVSLEQGAMGGADKWQGTWRVTVNELREKEMEAELVKV